MFHLVARWFCAENIFFKSEGFSLQLNLLNQLKLEVFPCWTRAIPCGMYLQHLKLNSSFKGMQTCHPSYPTSSIPPTQCSLWKQVFGDFWTSSANTLVRLPCGGNKSPSGVTRPVVAAAAALGGLFLTLLQQPANQRWDTNQLPPPIWKGTFFGIGICYCNC